MVNTREPGPAYLARRIMYLLRLGEVTVVQRKRLWRGKHHYGEHDPCSGTASISSSLNQDQKRQTLIHEALHEHEDRKGYPRADEDTIERRTQEVDRYLSPRRRGNIEFFLPEN